MKPWLPTIEQHIQNWSAKLVDHPWWPKYIYHFTDVQNAVNIIQSGHLFNRSEAIRQHLMAVDNASPEIIRQTHTEYQQFVRLYFRPRTPTLFCNEGIRPINQRVLDGAHCPIPIYFCFDAISVLSRDDCQYSDGNMGSPRANYSGNEKFFCSIPFNLVFHNGAIRTEEDKDEIIFRRHAEVLVPNTLYLNPDLKIDHLSFSSGDANIQTTITREFTRAMVTFIKTG